MLRRFVPLALFVLVACKQPALRTLAPGLQVTPAALAFGPVALGDAAALSVDLSNTGASALSLKSLTAEGDGLFVGAPNRDCSGQPREGGTQLLAGECARVTVRFAPKGRGPFQGNLVVESDDADHPHVLVPATALGAVALLKACVLDGAGQPTACTDLDARPQVVPTIDFGAVALGVVSTKKVRLVNAGDAAVTLANARLSPQTPADYSVPDGLPLRVEPGASADFALAVKASVNGAIRGGLVLASNDQRAPSLELPLLAVVQGWRLCVDPEGGLDFGSVAIAQSRTARLTLSNCGSVPFTFTSLYFGPYAPTTTELTLPAGALPATPKTFAPGDQLDLDVTYKPTAERADSASVDVAVSLPSGESLRDSYPIVGKGAPPQCDGVRPAANLVVRDAGGHLVDPTQTNLTPLQTVTLDGSASTAPSGGPQYLFRLVSQPANGNAALQGSGPTRTLMLPITGDYLVELVVKDAACQSSPVQTTLHVVPRGAVHVELTWKESYGDVDVHFVGPGGHLFDDGNCAAGQCGDTFFAHPRPDWGCANSSCSSRNGLFPDGDASNDPSLDIDQQWGRGPENITQGRTFDGTYQVDVHYWCAHKCNYNTGTCTGGPWGNATVTANVYVNGVLKLSTSKVLQEFQSWNAAQVTVSGGGTQVTVTDPGAAPAANAQGCLRH